MIALGDLFPNAVPTAARASWSPTPREQVALAARSHVDDFSRVDEMWPWLAANHPEVMAVDAPHAAHPERFSYRELAARIATTAEGLRQLGIDSGDVVGLFAENSPRWLVMDQGLMRAGAISAVRGAAAPVPELHYILQDSAAVALVVQNADLLRRLDLTDAQRARLRCVIQLEGCLLYTSPSPRDS